MHVQYCRRWHFKQHKPIDAFTPAQARKRNAAPDVYTVALFDEADQPIPTAVLEIDWPNNFAGVWFFDDLGRRTLNYAFRRQDDKLFLFDIIHYTYPSVSGRSLADATAQEELTFRHDGVVRSVITDEVAQQKIIEDRRNVDVTNHWEPVPAFGHWDSLARWDRS